MKITQVEIFYVTTRPQSGQRPILVKVSTDEGIYGIGEAGMAYGKGGSGAVGAIRDFSSLLIGQDPFATEKIWETLFKKTFWGQGGGTVIFTTISALDIALWDIKGKALGVPVYQLLGGKTHSSLRAYASQLQLGWGPERYARGKTEDYVAEAQHALDDGYDAIKVDVLSFDREGKTIPRVEGPLPHWIIALGEERVQAIRETIGPDVDIIIENHGRTDITSAIQFARAIEKYNIYLYEEINTPLNPSLLRIAKHDIHIPLASGERIYSRFGYLPYFTDRSLDVIQPDLGSCGGFSEFRKIADMAHAYEITVQAHVAGTGVAEAAAIQAEAAIPNFIIHEHHQKTLLKEYRELVQYDYQPVNGQYAVPDLPGIGQDITEEVYKQSEYFLVNS